MRNIFKRIAAGVGLVVALLLAGPAVANAYSQEDLNRIASSMQSGTNVVDAYGVVGNASSVNAALKPLNIGVAVVDFGGRSSGSGMEAATKIQGQSGIATVAVFSSDNPRAAYVYGANAEEFATAVNTSIGEGSSVEQALLEGADVLVSSNVQAENTEKSNAVANFFKGVLIVVLVLILLTVAFISAAVWFVKKRIRAAKKAKEVHVDNISERVDVNVNRLNELKHLYPRTGPVTQDMIGSLLTHLDALFKILKENGNREQFLLAEVEYNFKIGEITKALEENSYLKILQNPTYWTEPEVRKQKIAQAVKSVDEEILNNIRKANASNDLEFSVVLEMLSKSLDDIDPLTGE